MSGHAFDRSNSEASHAPWSRSVEQVADDLTVDVARGLSAAEALRRRQRFGSNRLREPKSESVWRILVRQFESFIVILLLVAAAVAIVFGQAYESAAIAAVLGINAAIGFVTEWRAVRSMEALRLLGRVHARVRRDGELKELAGIDLVPGDVVAFEAGDLVPADLRLVDVSKLQADESALTGESSPVGKRCEPLDVSTPLADRRNMLYRGTVITRGSGKAVIVTTGMGTEIGHIATLVEEAEAAQSPLELRLERLGMRLVWVTVALALAIVVSGVLAGRDLLLMVETGIALAVATVPEGLPIVATLALGRGMWRMARSNALVNRLAAVETLGATTVICCDKTGTLTENRMSVSCVVVDGESFDLLSHDLDGLFERGESTDGSHLASLRAALEIGVLCNNAELSPSTESEATGEPMEVALLLAGRKLGIERQRMLARTPEAREEAFTPESRQMATCHRDDGSYRVAVKGAPEAVLAASSRALTSAGDHELDEATRRRWLQRNGELAARGLRVLAVATKTVTAADVAPYEDLVFVGLMGLIDPPRADVREALDRCRQAGIRIVMVTGDQPGTAAAVAQTLGMARDGAVVVHGTDLQSPDALPAAERRRILDSQIFARVSPKQKLDLIAIHQQEGEIVGMTGDGVNDAPALKKADIGIAMGKRGTQVAIQAADIVLRDDAFSTIVAAIEQGRIIFDNIRRFVFYLLSCNVSEVLVVAAATLASVPLPITPLQILFLNLVTDVFPALALGVGEGDPGIMRRPPRDPREAILTRGHWLAIGGYGLLISACVLGALAFALRQLGLDREAAVTISFLTLAFAQLCHVFNMADRRAGLLRNDVVRNPWIWGALALCAGLLLAAVYVPVLARTLNIVPPDARGWMVVAALSLAPLVIGQVARLIDSGKTR